MTEQEQNSTSGDIERFMQDRQSFGILNLLGMKIITAEASTGATVYNIVEGEQRAIEKVLGMFSFSRQV